MSGCDDAREATQLDFDSGDGERLVVATDLPAPGFWNEGSGFEFEIAELLAERFGLELSVVDVPFPDIVSGELGDADLAIAQISVTAEREDLLDFSVPYYSTDSAVVGRRGEKLTDLKTAREQVWVAEAGSTQERVIVDELRPDVDHLVAPNALETVQLVLDGDADAALVDLPTAYAILRQLDPEGSSLEVIAAVATRETYAVAVVESAPSRNLEAVNAALRAFESDGTLADLIEEWLLPLYGTDPADLPVIRIR